MSEVSDEVTGAPPLLSVSISVDYPGKPGVLKNVRFEVQRGEVLGLVGQSGAGKSTISLAILKLLDTKGGAASGQVLLDSRDLMPLSQKQMREVRGKQIGLVLQSPLSSLNPSLTVGTQLREAWRAHKNGPAPTRDLLELLKSVSLPAEEALLRSYPRQLSVGLAQRFLIALAILHRPPLLIADEPTSALDVITQAGILQLFTRLNRELRMGILYISHDLLSIACLCNRIAILHRGEIVETGTTEQIFTRPAHPYTQELIASLPRNPF